MLKMVLRRILQMIPVLFVVVCITFVITRMIPGNPAEVMAGLEGDDETIAWITEKYSLDQPYYVQFFNYIGDLLKGDFGTSLSYDMPVTQLIAEKLPNTLLLALTALVLSTVFGVAAGMISAVKQYSAFDYACMMLALIGISMPIFWMALMLVLEFSVKLGWFPVYGMGSIEKGIGDVLKHMVLPTICLMAIPCATFARITRSSMLDVIRSDFINALRSRGIRPFPVTVKHAFKNAMPPLLTVFGLQLAHSFTGAILTESIFTWPGMGTLIRNAISKRDYILIQGTVLLTALVFVGVNMVVDIAYMLVDPRIDFSSGRRK